MRFNESTLANQKTSENKKENKWKQYYTPHLRIKPELFKLNLDPCHLPDRTKTASTLKPKSFHFFKQVGLKQIVMCQIRIEYPEQESNDSVIPEHPSIQLNIF